jgi:hypothetical protein
MAITLPLGHSNAAAGGTARAAGGSSPEAKGAAMAYSIELERAFLAKEFRTDQPSPLRVVGTLLDSAFEQGPEDGEIERLCAMLSR